MGANCPIKVAQIGVGYWGPNLLRNLVANEDYEVKTVVELSKERQAFVKGLYPSINVTDDFESVLDDDTTDAVIIATPVATHYDLVIKALQAEKHILVEKPMATSVEQVRHIGEVAKANELVAMAGHTFIFNNAIRYLKKLIESGELGTIRYIYSQRLNLGRIRADVDALWNLGPHDVSIIQYLLNNQSPISVVRKGMDYVQKGIDDVVFMDITYPNKILAHIHVSWLDPNKVRKMVVVGSNKMVVYDDIVENKITIYDKGIDKMAVLGENMDYDCPGFTSFNHRSGDIHIPKIEFTEPLRAEIEHFLDCINKREKCLTDAEHAKSVIEILSLGKE